MACFTVPLATAVAASAAKGALRGSSRNPFVSKIGWLGKMMFGGSFLLAIEHVYHGEIMFSPPFLTAVKEGDTAGMLHEMATRGVAMTVLIVAVWAAMVVFSTSAERSAKAKGAAACANS